MASPCHCPFVGCQAPWHKKPLLANDSLRCQPKVSTTAKELKAELLECYVELREQTKEINELRQKVYEFQQNDSK